MGVSCRMFLLDQDDHLYRLPNTKFALLRQDPEKHRILQFAGQRVRLADVMVELVERQPTQVIQITFGMLIFDEVGRFDPQSFDRQQFARAEWVMAPASHGTKRNAAVVDAVNRFVAKGGAWSPSRTLDRAIRDAALGRINYAKL